MNVNNFMEYLNKPVGFENLKLYHKSNNINPVKTEIYYDFIFGLLHIIRDTYPGDDVMASDNTINNHFKFCWDKNLKNFELENIILEFSNISVYSYLFNMSYDLFYNYNDKDTGSSLLFTTFNKLFNLDDKLKSKSDLDIFIEIYKTFNKTITIKKNEDNTNIK